MIGRITVLFLALLLAGPALSKPVRVRTGEHENYTRIVFDLPKRVEWKLTQEDGKAILAFAGQEFEFDTGRVFNRLSEGRVNAILGGPGNESLTIELGCECELDTFWYGRSSLVVDIRDAAESTIEAPKPQVNEQTTEPPSEPVQVAEMRQASAPPLIFPNARSSIAAALTISEFAPDMTTATAEDSATGETKISDPIVPQAPQRNLLETRDRLLRQIGRAASQGLLSPNVGLPSKTGRQKEPDQGDTSSEYTAIPMISEAEAGNAGLDQINLRAQSSIDRDFLSTLSQATGDSIDVACLEPNQIDVTNWGTDDPFARQIGAVRVRLSGEFDKTDEAAAMELTRLYLYFGFGVEARQALKLVTDETPDTALLKDMAAIFENGYAPVGSQLSGQLNCGVPVSLWSALSYQTLPTDLEMDDNAILRGFNALPPHLRSYLGPILSRRLLEAGHETMSDRVLRILNRTEETTTPESDLVKAEIDIAADAHNGAEVLLDDVVTSGAKPSAEALLLKIETALEAGREISLKTAQLAGAYAQENRDKPLGHELSQVYVVSLAASGAFDQSYQEFARLKPELGPENQRVAQSKMLGFLAANADDMTFLKHVFSDYVGQPDIIDEQVVNATAKRLLDLGFTTKARQILTPQAVGEQGRVRAILHAEISLRENLPRQAEVDLLGLAGEDVNLLRAKARSLVGEHKAAAQLFAMGNQPDMAKREAWLAEDWDMLLAANDPVLTDVAMLVESGNKPPDTEAALASDLGVLAQDRALIEASSSTRNTIKNLLQSQPGPDGQKE